jgi:cytochrome b
MNTTSASRAERSVAAMPTRRVLVWDAPVRTFHWLMVVCFAGAWLTAESERWRLLHATFGYTMAGLVAFRLVWGLVGTKHARFASFVRAPAAVLRYLNGLLRGAPEHHAGHNPAGGLAIIALLGAAAVVVLSGWATYNDVARHWVEELHEGAAEALMALVVLHLAGVAVSSWLHRENLVAAMLTGRKPGTPADAVKRAWRGVAALMIAAVLAFWGAAWQAPSGGTLAGGERSVPSAHARPAR